MTSSPNIIELPIFYFFNLKMMAKTITISTYGHISITEFLRMNIEKNKEAFTSSGNNLVTRIAIWE